MYDFHKLVSLFHNKASSHLSLVMRNRLFAYAKTKTQISGNREADQRLCFRYTDSTILSYLNPKFQASSHLQWLYSLVCVGPGRKPRRPVFSERGSFYDLEVLQLTKSETIKTLHTHIFNTKFFSKVQSGSSFSNSIQLKLIAILKLKLKFTNCQGMHFTIIKRSSFLIGMLIH